MWDEAQPEERDVEVGATEEPQTDAAPPASAPEKKPTPQSTDSLIPPDGWMDEGW